MNTRWGWLTLLLLLLLAACSYWIAHPGGVTTPRVQWIGVTAILIALCATAGFFRTGRVDGILIDDRNRVSLSRLQWVAWLIVLIGGYFSESIYNAAASLATASPDGGPFPTIQPELLALLGIASASPVASNLIVDTKKQSQGAAPAPVDATDTSNPARQGAIDVNGDIKDASWADLYLGEEVANRYVVDISRLQNLIFTALLIIIYVSDLWVKLAPASPKEFLVMPTVGSGFIWLLGISHASYLGYKATPKTSSPQANPSPTAPPPAVGAGGGGAAVGAGGG